MLSILKRESDAQYHFEDSKDLFKNSLIFAIFLDKSPDATDIIGKATLFLHSLYIFC